MMIMDVLIVRCYDDNKLLLTLNPRPRLITNVYPLTFTSAQHFSFAGKNLGLKQVKIP